MQEEGGKSVLKVKEIAAWVFLCLFVLAVLGAAPTVILLELKENQEALGWPTTSGRVLSSGVFQDSEDDHWCRITYDYEVDGKRVSGRSSLGLPGSRTPRNGLSRIHLAAR